MISTTVRCFTRKCLGEEGRRGLWLMTHDRRGVFYHGSRKEIQGPRQNISDLEKGDWVSEVAPEEAIKELENWPEAQEHAKKVFGRHPDEMGALVHMAQEATKTL